MYDFFTILGNFVEILGHLLRAIGFGLIGFGLAKFVLDAYPKSNWQLQMALALGFFGLLIALTVFSSAGSAGAFALGAGLAFFMAQKAPVESQEAAAGEK